MSEVNFSDAEFKISKADNIWRFGARMNQSTESTDRLANLKKVALINAKLGWLIQS